jgi:maltodextrin utilization protein YvdJ
MNDLIKSENLDITTTNELAEILKVEKQLKERKEEIKNQILIEMERKNIKKIDSDTFSITYKEPTEQERFDSIKFKKEHKNMYDEYIKFVNVKSSLLIKLK